MRTQVPDHILKKNPNYRYHQLHLRLLTLSYVCVIAGVIGITYLTSQGLLNGLPGLPTGV